MPTNEKWVADPQTSSIHYSVGKEDEGYNFFVVCPFDRKTAEVKIVTHGDRASLEFKGRAVKARDRKDDPMAYDGHPKYIRLPKLATHDTTTIRVDNDKALRVFVPYAAGAAAA